MYTHFVVIYIQPILHPLHRVAGHIMHAYPADPARITADGLQPLAVHDVGLAAVKSVAPRIYEGLRTARGIFPFGFRRQSSTTPTRIRFCLVPGDIHAWVGCR